MNDLSTHFFSIFINFATINFYDDFKFYKNRIDMNGTKMKNLFGKGMLGILLGGIITLSVYPLSAQTNSRSGKGLYEIFSTKIPDGAQWKAQDNKFVRDGGYSKKSENYIYVGASKSPAELTGLSIPIRENPGPGEFRYILLPG